MKCVDVACQHSTCSTLVLHLTVIKNTTVERVGQKKPSMLRESSNVFENFRRDKLTEKKKY